KAFGLRTIGNGFLGLRSFASDLKRLHQAWAVYPIGVAHQVVAACAEKIDLPCPSAAVEIENADVRTGGFGNDAMRRPRRLGDSHRSALPLGSPERDYLLFRIASGRQRDVD